MERVQMQCPSCGGEVELGDIECVHCGVNLKSGESYESRLRQARGKARHPEHFAGRVYLGVVVAFFSIIFAGYMYQRSMEEVIQERPDLFPYPILKLEEVESDLAIAAHAQESGDPETARLRRNRARLKVEALIEWMDAQERSIKPKEEGSSWSRRAYTRWHPEPEYNRRAAKRLIQNLKAKARRLLSTIPGSGTEQAS